MGLAALLLYTTAVTASLGFIVSHALDSVFPDQPVISVLSRYALVGLLGLFPLRFFLQRTPHVSIRPYLHLPVSQTKLIWYFQFSSLASLHNLLPILFLLPFWIRETLLESQKTAPGVLWMTGFCLLMLVSHYGVLILRSLLDRSLLDFFIGISVLGIISAADLILGQQFLLQASSYVFQHIAQGNLVVWLLLVFVTFLVIYWSGLLFRKRLQEESACGDAQPLWQITFDTKQGEIINLMLLEVKMMFRNKRPRTYFLISVVLGTVYVGMILANFKGSPVGLVGAVLGVFASGMFAANYGQLMFSWESCYFDGFLSRAHSFQGIVLAKTYLLQLSCALLFVVSLPVFLLMRPDLTALHISFLFYNAGITVGIMMVLAIHNRKRLNLIRNGFMNYEGFTLAHWFWFILAIIPAAVVFHLLSDNPEIAMGIIAASGVAGIFLTRPLSLVLARHLARRRYVMADGFRYYER